MMWSWRVRKSLNLAYVIINGLAFINEVDKTSQRWEIIQSVSAKGKVNSFVPFKVHRDTSKTVSF